LVASYDIWPGNRAGYSQEEDKREKGSKLQEKKQVITTHTLSFNIQQLANATHTEIVV